MEQFPTHPTALEAVKQSVFPFQRAARQWVDSEITTGKLLQLFGVPRSSGDDLVGQLWHAYRDKWQALQADLQQQLERCEPAIAEAEKNKWTDSVVAETARKRALTECLAKLQFHFGHCFTTTKGTHDKAE